MMERLRTKSLSGQYSARRDKQFSNGKEHIHLFRKDNEIAVMNIDGTGSHNSKGYQLPNKIIKSLKQTYPDIRIPNDGILESLKPAQSLLVEVDLATDNLKKW